jgi:leucyl aminopeptidase
MDSHMKIEFLKLAPKKSPVVVFFAADGSVLSKAAQAFDKTSGGLISRAMKATKFTGKRDQSIELVVPSKDHERVFVYGMGEIAKLKPLDFEMIGGSIAGMLMAGKISQAAIMVDLGEAKDVDAAALIASGATLRNYGFEKYKTKKPDAPKKLETLHIVCENVAKSKKSFASLQAISEGVHMARDLVNEPANILYPEEFSARAKQLTKLGVKIEILNAAQMKKLGMGALLGVSQGSPFAPQLVVMRWDGGPKGEPPVAFVGKGVTFDTGGVSIKPAAGMEDMKGDMGGAACVTGLMLALAKRKAKCNVIGAIGLVENAIDGKAQRPGDVVKSMSGQTIAVLNTDAEGRLILADVLWYVQDRFKPKFMVNLATLTGAILVALGKEHAGLFSNNDELSERLTAAGLTTGEKVWRMPLSAEYDKLIDSDIADMKNIGGRFGGSISAAQFLQRFVNKVPWAHLDIAGTAIDGVKTSINQSWGSGWGVRLLNKLVANHYEK